MGKFANDYSIFSWKSEFGLQGKGRGQIIETLLRVKMASKDGPHIFLRFLPRIAIFLWLVSSHIMTQQCIQRSGWRHLRCNVAFNLYILYFAYHKVHCDRQYLHNCILKDAISCQQFISWFITLHFLYVIQYNNYLMYLIYALFVW